MAIGDIRMLECKIGDLDLNDPNQASFKEINIVEDITSTYGPACEIRVVDQTDARVTKNINGAYNQDVKVRFSDELGRTVGFNLKQFEGADLTDHAEDKEGSGKNAQFTVKCVSPELLNAQGNYIERSWEDKTTNIAKKILEEGYKTDKNIYVEETNEKLRWISSNKHPYDALDEINEKHVSTKNKSSCFFTYQKQKDGKSEYRIETVEEMFKRAPVAEIIYSTTLDSSASSEKEKLNSALWVKVDSNFYSGSRHLTKPSSQTFNLANHKASDVKYKPEKFTLPGKEIYEGQTSNHESVPQREIYSKTNQPAQPITTAEATKNRADFLSKLAQNCAECEIAGNPDITLGSMISLKIPKRVDGASGFGSGESQFADKCLVVGIRHRIRENGESPRYTMVLKLVKASFAQSSGGTA